jgi:dihydrofolate reductase/thymidylate synthase
LIFFKHIFKTSIIIMKFNIILAVDKYNGIAKKGMNIPWYFSSDLKYFKKITSHTDLPFTKNAVIMGRKTAESLPNKYLPDRLNIILSKNEKYINSNAIITNDFNKALSIAEENKVDTTWIIGGAEIYKLAFRHHQLDKIYLTIINEDYKCDIKIDLPELNIIKSNSRIEEDKNIVNVIATPIQSCEQSYLNLLQKIIDKGENRITRNAVTYSLFSEELKFSVKDSFPLLTTKRMFWRGIVEELLFFIRGEVDTKKLEDKNINIWKGNTNSEFLKKMNLDYEEGIMGPMYGYQWRFFNKPFDQAEGGIDQLKDLIQLIKQDPHSRRLLMTDYNPSQVNQGVLYPCHSLILQFYVKGENLSVKMYQRSADSFLGLPFNIASTSLLLTIIAKLCNLVPDEVTLTLGDCHVYECHLDAVKKQLTRDPLELPKLNIPDFKTLEEVENSIFEDYEIVNYKHQGGIKAEMVA